MAPHLGRECPEHRNLPSREKLLGDFRDCQIETDALEVDAHFPSAGDCVKGDSVGVGHAKADRIPVSFSGKARLSMRAVAKGQAFGHAVQVATEDRPEHASSDDEVLAIPLEVKPLSSRQLIRSKVAEEALNLWWALVQDRSPDMNLIAI
jgi:hypothetical protein